MDDREIIELYQNRSEQAISETSKKYGKYCHYIAYTILHNKEDAEECVNDAFLRVWNTIPPHQPNNLQTFIGKITRNLSLNRREKLSAEKRGGGQADLIFEELAPCLPSQESMEHAADSMVIREAMNRFLGALPLKTRKIFVRRYWYMCSVKEIAEEYGLPESKVAVTLFRTREKLKTALKKEGIIL